MEDKSCIGCKFFEQGETHSFCANPLQPRDQFKKYCYYNFSCELFEKGRHQTRIDYMEKTKSQTNEQGEK